MSGDISVQQPSSFYLRLKSNRYVRKCLTAFLPLRFIFQDGRWVWFIIAKREGKWFHSAGQIRFKKHCLRASQAKTGGVVGVGVGVTWHAFFTANEYFAAPVSVSSAAHKPPCSPQHKQAINQQGFSCQDERCATFAETVIPLCISHIQSGSYWHIFYLSDMVAEGQSCFLSTC